MTRWGKQDDDVPMTRQQMLEFKAEFDREVARLVRLPKGHRDLHGGSRKLSPREVRYLAAREEFRQTAFWEL